MNPLIWLGVAAVMAVAEILSLGLITMWFVIGALVAFLVNLFGGDLIAQLIVFVVVSVVCLVVLRPVVLKHRNRAQSSEPTNIGVCGIVTEDIDNYAMTGRVELPDHMTWTARSQDGRPIEAGVAVNVVAQESVKLIVERKSP